MVVLDPGSTQSHRTDQNLEPQGGIGPMTQFTEKNFAGLDRVTHLSSPGRNQEVLEAPERFREVQLDFLQVKQTRTRAHLLAFRLNRTEPPTAAESTLGRRTIRNWDRSHFNWTQFGTRVAVMMPLGAAGNNKAPAVDLSRDGTEERQDGLHLNASFGQNDAFTFKLQHNLNRVLAVSILFSRTFNRFWVQVRFWSSLWVERPVLKRLELRWSPVPQDPEGNTLSRDGWLIMAAPFGRLLLLTLLLFCCGSGSGSGVKAAEAEEAEDCRHLRLGQYPSVTDPNIDESTQEPENCRNGVAFVDCLPAPNVTCRLSNGTEVRFSGDEVGFNRTVTCRNVTGYSYKVAVALSLFLGWLGADRFYLGYPAL
ncbi:hypothetical protein CCH79_00020870, partial [Gambusia affinis]